MADQMKRQHTQGLKIQSVTSGSLAQQADIRPGDLLLCINSHPIRDEIDVQFYGADETLELLIQRNNESITYPLTRTYHDYLGLEFEPMRFSCCGNHCTFCFIDQNPKGLRRSLYFKDEDYRLSFLHGNYVTLTQLQQSELERIVEQRLSPLYISIHAIDPVIRFNMLGLKKEDHLLEKLDFLAENHIEMHGQIVLCPGINDGKILDDTISALVKYYPQIQSLAIVPVGLTRHRKGLTPLQSFRAENAAEVIRQVYSWQKKIHHIHHSLFVFLADEFYLLAGAPIPEGEQYEQFWQIENGVGMMRAFLDDFNEAAQYFPKHVERNEYFAVTGKLAASVLEQHILPVLNAVDGLTITLKPVENVFYGPDVTVSGLLTGQDILQQVHQIPESAGLLLPENSINADGLFLDDWTPEMLSQKLHCPVHVLSNFESLLI